MVARLETERIIVELDSLPKPTDLSELFASANPLELEVGVGKGGFLLAQAQARPDVNFLGIEWANEYYRYAADRFARWGLTNVRMLRTDAAAFLKSWLATGCLDALHVYFPDPWPKRRHHKRRFFQPATVEQVVRVLRPGGRLCVASDHAEYFGIIAALVCGRPEFAEIPFPPEFGGAGELVGSNFERKYVRQGRPIHTLAVCKVAGGL